MDWEFTIDPDNITEEQEKKMEEGDKEREGFIRDCIENQIATWTVQRINGKNTIKIPTNDHVKIVYDLINDIAARRMEIHNTKTKGSDSNPDADSSLDDMVKEITGRKEADLKQREEAEQERKKEAEKQQRKMSEYSDSD